MEITDTEAVEGVNDVWFRFSFSDSGASGCHCEAVDIFGSVTNFWNEVNRKGKVNLFLLSISWTDGKFYTVLSVLINHILNFYIVHSQF